MLACFLDQQHHYHLGTGQKCKFSGPSPGLLNQKFREWSQHSVFNKAVILPHLPLTLSFLKSEDHGCRIFQNIDISLYIKRQQRNTILALKKKKNKLMQQTGHYLSWERTVPADRGGGHVDTADKQRDVVSGSHAGNHASPPVIRVLCAHEAVRWE